jgi:hypothetical protein
MSSDDIIKKHFGNCDNCEPTMCCSGSIQSECGCRGYPVDFVATDKCLKEECWRKQDLLEESMELLK